MGLIGWVLFGGAFRPDPPDFEVTEVSVISAAAFEALTAPPSAATEVALPLAPTEDVEPASNSEPDPVAPVAPPEAAAEPEPDAVPEPPAPDVTPEIVQEIPDAPPAPLEPSETVDAPELSERPVPRAAERIAPEPVAPPEDDATPDPVEQAALTPDPTPEPPPEEPAEAQEETAPEESATEITTEAETPSNAPAVSKRPPARRPAPPAQVAETPQPEPQSEPAPESAPEPAPEPRTDSDAVNAALAEALGQSAPASDLPAGPPLTGGEEQGFLRQVEQCWNVGALSTAAQNTIVTIAFSLGEDGKPRPNSLKLIGQSGGTEASARQAYETARRAILICGRQGYDLPADKYAHWKDIELTFNPEKMRLR